MNQSISWNTSRQWRWSWRHFIETRLNPHKGKHALAAATNIFKTPEQLIYSENYWTRKYQYGHPWKTWRSACGTLFHSAFAWPSIPSWTWKSWPGYLGEPTSFSQGSSPISQYCCVRGVYTSSQRINLISDLWKSESTAISIRPSFVLLHVGSNDLAQMTHVNKTSAKNSAMLVVDFANSLVNDLGVNWVIFNSVVPRDSSNMQCSADVFSTNINHFNSVLLKEADKHKHLIYNHLRGFYKVKVDNKDLPLAISTWSHDGIHCNETAMAKYVQRTRFGIISALATTHKWV